MVQASVASRFFRRVRGQKPAPEQDAADMGTAFGLEVSLDAPTLPVPAHPRAAATPNGWLRRLTRARSSER